MPSSTASTHQGVVAFLRRMLSTQAVPADELIHRPSSHRLVWAVRRDWPLDGTHEFVCPRSGWHQAVRQQEKDRAFWRTGPIRPVLSVVCMSAHEFALHGRARRECRAPDCAIEQMPELRW